MTLAEISDRDLLLSLRGGICPACAGLKKNNQSLCRSCYFALPRQQREDLYDLIGDGYAEAMSAAFKTLSKTEFVEDDRT